MRRNYDLQVYGLKVEYSLQVLVAHAQRSLVSGGIRWYSQVHFVKLFLSET